MRIAAVAAVALAILTSACAPIKGYPGPDRPDAELAVLQLEYDSSSIRVSDARTNGVEFSSTGVKLLPGQHTFAARISVLEPPDHCYAYPQMDHYGYSKCLDKHERCDCFSYLSVHRKCTFRVRDGECEGKFKGEANSRYDILVSRSAEGADLTVVEAGSARRAGAGSCDVDGPWRTETSDDYVGSGRSTAQRHGIYACY